VSYYYKGTNADVPLVRTQRGAPLGDIPLVRTVQYSPLSGDVRWASASSSQVPAAPTVAYAPADAIRALNVRTTAYAPAVNAPIPYQFTVNYESLPYQMSDLISPKY